MAVAEEVVRAAGVEARRVVGAAVRRCAFAGKHVAESVPGARVGVADSGVGLACSLASAYDTTRRVAGALINRRTSSRATIAGGIDSTSSPNR